MFISRIYKRRAQTKVTKFGGRKAPYIAPCNSTSTMKNM